MGLNIKVGEKSKFYAFGVFHFEKENEAVMLKFSIISETGLKKDLRLIYEFLPGTVVFSADLKAKGTQKEVVKKAYDDFIDGLIPKLTEELEKLGMKKVSEYHVLVEDGNSKKMMENLKDSGMVWYGEGKTTAEAKANLITQKTGGYDERKH